MGDCDVDVNQLVNLVSVQVLLRIFKVNFVPHNELTKYLAAQHVLLPNVLRIY